jgi:Mg2+/Co2+ transporter CorB
LEDIPFSALLGALIFLVFVSAFFSAAEIAMVSLNRHRLRHLASSGHRGAKLANRLLERPDRLIGVILLGSNAVNALFASLTTLAFIHLVGEEEAAVGFASVVITLVILILTDLAPKTLAVLHPERIALPSAFLLTPLLKLAYPVVWVVNAMANGLLRLFGVSVKARPTQRLSPEEFRSIVMEAGVLIPESHQDMLLAILDLEKATVNDVMVPRGRIQGIDVEQDWNEIVAQLTASRFTRLPVYKGNLDNVIGMAHTRRVLNLMREGSLDQEEFLRILADPYFIPSGTSLTTQLLNFRDARRRIGLVVDEYGDIQGLVTLDEILEEIVGDFTTRTLGKPEDVTPQPDGSYLVRGTVSLRDLNRRLDWNLPIEESRTLNGLITEALEDLPAPGTSLMIAGYTVEILRTRGTAVEIARIKPAEAAKPEAEGTETKSAGG